MVLRDCQPGSSVRLSGHIGGHPQRRRLLELGFVPGAVIRVIGRGAVGGLVVALDDARLALDARTGGSMVVEPVG
jgi:Fe2+ transport system protein FeoA